MTLVCQLGMPLALFLIIEPTVTLQVLRQIDDDGLLLCTTDVVLGIIAFDYLDILHDCFTLPSTVLLLSGSIRS